MNMSRKSLVSIAGSLALALAASGVVAAQDSMPANSSMRAQHAGMMKGMHGNMKSMHMMPATVTTVDTKTGLVEAESEGMALKLHFPPVAVADLKAGDKITLHMGFSKP
ncbi:hypothetical protein RHOFW510R12_13465 [Rhodanobacter sp. FW510-R12]|uniref:hypothetical protein n=1 Tax=unclassified Rhodanobacter TaxID=2621553 RepID=UPI0007A999F3|nr:MULTISPECIES: hypothetical protein [unclassified Rhodanobacter]KZC16231.1 hypothetical protein RHOFW104R8_00825 [Rhodanobacter sp. FW104-R8]KZC26506.1 hypothetical protein RhoFW510T8_01970 [Rhodanobacter sp. FW510-T8]KZC30641.1 hypothetical protein RhoFW510R10_01550 [Rhodanobacter sp. FW510-R10]